jgi:hypothetical protein
MGVTIDARPVISFAQRHPRVKLPVSELSTDEIEASLEQCELPVGLLWHRENYLCSASRAFLEMAKTVTGAFAPLTVASDSLTS